MHGKYFASTGPADDLDWFETNVGEEYEISIGPRLGLAEAMPRRPGFSAAWSLGTKTGSTTKPIPDKLRDSLENAP